MNIFLLDRNPSISAEYHADQHVNKMILEAAQMMCYAAKAITKKEQPYKTNVIGYAKHPASMWVSKSMENATWLSSLAHSLNLERLIRFNKNIDHKSIAVLDEAYHNMHGEDYSDVEPDEWALAMPTQYHENNAFSAYRNYYKHEKRILMNRPASWTNRKIPHWFVT